jgi:hypothetical protein
MRQLRRNDTVSRHSEALQSGALLSEDSESRLNFGDQRTTDN